MLFEGGVRGVRIVSVERKPSFKVQSREHAQKPCSILN